MSEGFGRNITLQLFSDAGLKAVAEAEGAVPQGVQFEAELGGEALAALNAGGLVALVIGQEELAFIGFPGGEAGFEGGVFAFDVVVGDGGGKVCQGFQAMAAVGFFLEKIAGDAVEEGGKVLDLFAFFEPTGETGEGVIGEGFRIDGVFPEEDADEAGAEILIAQGGLVAIRMEGGEETGECFGTEGPLRRHRFYFALLGLAVEDEGGPVPGVAVAGCFAEGGAGVGESFSGGALFGEQGGVEVAHEFGGGLIVDAPESGEDPVGSGVEKGVGEAQQAFAVQVFAERGAAGGEGD